MDKDSLRDAFINYQQGISEYTFTNLWVWRRSKPSFLSRIDQTILVFRGNADGTLFMLPPLGKMNISTIFEMVKERMPGNLEGIYGLTKDEAKSLTGKKISILEDRNNWDYVYRVEDLIQLQGSKYRTKRQNINQCLAENECVYSTVTPNIITECLALQDEWCNLRECESDSGLIAENEAIRELLTNYDTLLVFGGTIRIKDQIEAFTMAERLNEDTAVVHFEKANPHVKGLYQVINQWFCKNSLQDYLYVNREQDLGIEGLRRAKKEYYPHHMVQKYLVKFN